MENRLRRLTACGQSVWLDFIRRGMLDSGELQRLIDDDGVSGITSNPAIFEQAIEKSTDYDAAIAELATGSTTEAIYAELVLDDIRRAADLLLPIWRRTGGGDGYVSLEVSPHLARDTAATIAEARLLWQRLERPNAMIKVPATLAGIAAIEVLIADGINVNATLLFSVARYRQVTEAYNGGLERRLEAGKPLSGVASVASFFLSRIDTLVDSLLDPVSTLRGQAAVACAKLAWDIQQETFSSRHFASLLARGARKQRLLWASTSTKNPAYGDLKYVEPLIGAETINTMPIETLAAYRDHGDPTPRVGIGLAEARRALAELAEAGIDLAAVGQQLEDEGVAKFVQAYDRLLAGIARRREALSCGR